MRKTHLLSQLYVALELDLFLGGNYLRVNQNKND
jgi:hypothetical protein